MAKKLTENAQIKAAFVLLLQKQRMDVYLHQTLTKQKREELMKFNTNIFLDALAMLKITNDSLIGAQNYLEGIIESGMIPFSKEFWDRVSFILNN